MKDQLASGSSESFPRAFRTRRLIQGYLVLSEGEELCVHARRVLRKLECEPQVILECLQSWESSVVDDQLAEGLFLSLPG
ncbi:hypothetical protein L915_21898 [Phytophthora nicotianae]|uniref:Uncharacterized protein n=1 Tax=Phytophthora nicotianae TaxID=4792 RepID=W2FJ31_PHYNI|nr:hypothetical protein L915_21898 [Phytophthora nicotianae]ETL24229.1 hypothetical protein L916_21758 [Phytophthora nicotianae]